MKYCYECGGLLEDAFLNDREGKVPKCTRCGRFQFPVFSAAVSMIVQSPEKDRILLIQQYGRKDNILAAGYIGRGESAEDAVIREVKEETGLDVTELHFNRSEFFEKSNTLMLNFICTVSDTDLSGTDHEEVDKAQWFSLDQAKKEIKHPSLAEKFLLHYSDRRNAAAL